ncbi:MAG: flagellar basal body rod protein FlgB [Burkholderiales bacterium]|nr:flagellar basal body rod protein FlgB [Burkholderiales bacterium]MDE2504619.1 flagellar basal body rod protein FlgB [Burkholderiales bacterium]
MIPGLNAELDFQGQALLLRAQRQALIASNIANADTPGYQARDFDFATALRDATGRGGPGRRIGADIIGGNGGGGAPTPELQYAVPSQTSLDNNTVDLDRERAAFVDNSVKYESTLRFINYSIKNTMDALKSFKQF